MGGILAIDQGTAATGWAHCEPGQPPEWGHKSVSAKTEGEVFFAFRHLIMARIEFYKPSHLVFERPYIPRPLRSESAKPFNINTQFRLIGFRALLICIAEECGLACSEMDSRAVAKSFTGTGKFSDSEAKKNAVMAVCWARGWKIKTTDEADAVALLMCFEAELYPEYALKRARVLKAPEGPLFSAA